MVILLVQVALVIQKDQRSNCNKIDSDKQNDNFTIQTSSVIIS